MSRYKDKTQGPPLADATGARPVLQSRPTVAKQEDNVAVPDIVSQAIQSPGQPLETETRKFMESRFEHDFSGVRVHTGERATESARVTNAHAYTVGEHVVFGSGQYNPHTTEGAWLLAHELAHVAQQGADETVQTLSLEPEGGRAELEASGVANAIVGGQPVPRIVARSDGVTVKRTVLGGIAGGLLGALGGAALGFLAGGPVGAIIGGLLGGVAGLVAGDVVSSPARPLTGDERREAQIPFGSSLNMNEVRLVEAPIMAIGGFARTPFNTIYFPPGTLALPPDQLMPWLIHELTHVWQHQHGISVFEKLFWALHGASAYDYGGESALRQAAAQGKRFIDFNTEQQADILKDYYIKKKGGQDVSAYEPFVAQVQGSTLGRGVKDSRIETDKRTV